MRSPRALLPLPLLLAAACSDGGPPAVRAGEVEFSERELLGLSPARREELALLAALGATVAHGGVEALGAPLVEHRRRLALARLGDARRTLEAAGVGDDVLRARYLTDPAYELSVRHLIVLSERWREEDARRQARAKAERALARIRRGEAFGRVAAEVSEEPGAEGREGLLSPGREGAWVPEFWRAANALAVGEVSGVVETQYGFHVLRLEGRDTVAFEEARAAMTTEVAALVDPLFDRAAPPLPGDLRWAPDAVARATDPAAPDTALLASWARGYTVGDYRRALAAMERAPWRAATLGPEDGRRAALEGAVALQAAASDAEDAGLVLPESDAAAIRRDWDDTAARWTAALGFAPGLDADAVGRAALAALAATGQNARLARSEVATREALVRYAVPVEVEGEP